MPELEAQGMEVITYPCLERCEDCLLRPYAFANGRWVERETAQELLTELLQLQETEDAPFADEPW